MDPDDLTAADADPLWPPQLPELLAAVRDRWLTGDTTGVEAVELGYVPNGTPAGGR